MSIPDGKLFQRGQAFLIVVLVMVVALTVGLSIASRSITNLRLTTEEVNSQRAFSAAEAGVEKLLQAYNTNINQSGQIINQPIDTATNTQISNATINPVNFQISGSTYQLVLNNNAPVAQDDGYDIWLTQYSSDPTQLYQNPWNGNLSVYWGDASTNTCDPSPSVNTMAALEVIVLYNSRANPLVARYTYDPCTAGRQAANHFTPIAPSTYTFGGKTFLYKATIGVTNGLIARVVPLYAGSVVGVSSTAALPAQGQLVVATGTSGSSAQVRRQVTYFQAWNALPSEYYNGLFVK